MQYRYDRKINISKNKKWKIELVHQYILYIIILRIFMCKLLDCELTRRLFEITNILEDSLNYITF